MDSVETEEQHSEVDDVPTRKRVLEPLGDRVIIRVVKDAEVLASGIVIPDSVRERSQRGIVLAVGPGRWENGERVPLGVAVGDMLLFSKYGGTELPEGFTDREADLAQLVLREADILCIERFEDEDPMEEHARTFDNAVGAIEDVARGHVREQGDYPGVHEDRTLDAVEDAITDPKPIRPDPGVSESYGG